MRVVAMVAVYNEERFIAGCLEHLIREGVEVYLLDNGSTDETRAIAERYVGRGLIAIEDVPRSGFFSLRTILERKERLAASLKADWFMHCDVDEFRLPPCGGVSLAEALGDVQRQGYNAVNFLEFTFTPTRESPDHDHASFLQTMRWYYPYLPRFPHRLNAWQRQPSPVELAFSGGHRVRFPGLQMYPESFRMRHYMFLSVEHAKRKHIQRNYDPTAVAAGWHKWRAALQPETTIVLPCQRELRTYTTDDELDPSEPRRRHYIANSVEASATSSGGLMSRLLRRLHT